MAVARRALHRPAGGVERVQAVGAVEARDEPVPRVALGVADEEAVGRVVEGLEADQLDAVGAVDEDAVLGAVAVLVLGPLGLQDRAGRALGAADRDAVLLGPLDDHALVVGARLDVDGAALADRVDALLDRLVLAAARADGNGLRRPLGGGRDGSCPGGDEHRTGEHNGTDDTPHRRPLPFERADRTTGLH